MMHKRASVYFIKYSIMLLAVALIGLGLWAQSSISVQFNTILINEIVGANDTGVNDADGNTSDWVELYNPTAHAISLAGYTLSDNPEQPLKWALPAVVIRPNSYLLIWLSGKDEVRLSGGVYHANFKLSSTGEFLQLYNAKGRLLDSVTLRQQFDDVAFGRAEKNANHWCYLDRPTPRGRNDSPCISVAQKPDISVASGRYQNAIQVALSAGAGADIHYTLDSAIPTKDSPKYETPLTIERTTVVRARSFRDGQLPSDTLSASYMIDLAIQLPILSLVTDPDHLWDEVSGIYVEGEDPEYPNFIYRGDAWEVPVSASLIRQDGGLDMSIEAGLRIFGGRSRTMPKKSFSLRFSEIYGPDTLNAQIFPNTDRQEFKMLIVRVGGDRGADDPRMRDAILHELWSEAGGVGSASRAVFVFLNGTPWGIYHLRERIDENFVAAHYGLSEIDLMRRTDRMLAGDFEHWETTEAFFETQDLAEAGNYEHAKTLIDIDSFIDHEVFQTYAANIDLVPANMLKFRPRTQDGKWQWFLWDMDVSFGLMAQAPVTHDTVAFKTRDGPRPDLAYLDETGEASADDEFWSTLFLRKLLAVDEFRTSYLNRFADLLNATLSPENVLSKIDHYVALLAPDMSFEMAIWKSYWGGSVEEWAQNVEIMRAFAEQRPDILRTYLVKHFNLGGTTALTVGPPQDGEGQLRINTLTIKSFPWTGTYFQDVSITLEAIAADGFMFAGWSDPNLPDHAVINISLMQPLHISPRFVRANQ